jgi:hypothetical protein
MAPCPRRFSPSAPAGVLLLAAASVAAAPDIIGPSNPALDAKAAGPDLRIDREA